MPLVRIALLQGKPQTYVQKVSDCVHRALVETISVPQQDRFQLITEYSKAHFIYDPAYLNIARTDDLVIIQITISQGRTVEVRKRLYERMVELLGKEVDLRPEDVFINLVEVAKENWSFGNGVAQYAT
jgi:phenylpyruvate tautomerase PptA (4-oxalocrotonate tautomerase family)